MMNSKQTIKIIQRLSFLVVGFLFVLSGKATVNSSEKLELENEVLINESVSFITSLHHHSEIPESSNEAPVSSNTENESTDSKEDDTKDDDNSDWFNFHFSDCFYSNLFVVEKAVSFTEGNTTRPFYILFHSWKSFLA